MMHFTEGMFPVCTIYPMYPIYVQHTQNILYIQYIQYIQHILSLDHIFKKKCHISHAELPPPTVTPYGPYQALVGRIEPY